MAGAAVLTAACLQKAMVPTFGCSTVVRQVAK